MKEKKNYGHVIVIVAFFMLSPLVNLYANYPAKVKPLTKSEQRWFDGKVWLRGIEATPDRGIDKVTFSRHYAKFPERWDKVFEFIKNNDLTTLPLGKQSLGDDVTVSVEEYLTREPGKELLEGHKKNIDLQYIVDGCELQGYAKIGTATEIVNPYSDKKDVGHYKVPVIDYHVVRPNQFTIFFPDDIHMTNIQYGEKVKVRKVVFKIAVE